MLYTELVLPGVLPLALLVERMTRRRRAARPADSRRSPSASPRTWPGRPRRALGGRRARLREQLGQLVLRGPHAARRRAADGRRRRSRLPRGGSGGGARVSPVGRRAAAAHARPRAHRACRDRRAGGVREGRRALRARSPRRRRSSCGARSALGLPVLVTEQYPRGLGDTVPAGARARSATVERLPKTVFSGRAAPTASTSHGRDQALVCGIETHVCVNQTVARPARRRRRGARRASTRSPRAPPPTASSGCARWSRAGAILTTVETALFELLGEAGTRRVQDDPEAGDVDEPLL